MLQLAGLGADPFAQAQDDQPITPAAMPILLFEDDFATYSGRWRELSSAKAVAGYRNEELHMRVVSPGVAVWSLPDFRVPLQDYRIAVKVRFNAGQRDGQAGVVVDYIDDEHFVAILVSADGNVRVLRRSSEGWQELSSSEQQRAYLLPGAAVSLRVEFRGKWGDSRLVVWVGDERAIEVPLRAMGGNISFGLVARAGRGYVDVSFDDVTVVALGGSREE